MTAPAANLEICAKALESLEKVTNTFSGKMDKLITAIGDIKISGGVSGGKKGGGGGRKKSESGDSELTREIEANIKEAGKEVTRETEANIKETRKNAKKLLETQLINADRENKESLRFARAQQAEAETISKAELAAIQEARKNYDESKKQDFKIFNEFLENIKKEKEEKEKHAYDVAVRENKRVADLATEQLAAVKAEKDAALAAIKKEEDYDLKKAKEQGNAIAKKEEEQRKRNEKTEAQFVKDEADYWKSVAKTAKENAEAEANAIEEEKVRSEKASADALKGIKKANENAAAKKIKDSSNFGGAKNFDIKAFLDSLKGGLLSGVVGAATQGFAVFQKSRQNVSNATGGKGAAGGAAAAAIGPIVGVMGGVTAAMGALTGGFSILIEMVGKFVGALDPAMMEQLNLAFADLSAVIGIGLRPIISAAVVIVRSFADALVPVMRKLEPVITKLASVLISIAIPLIVQWANQIEQSIPFLEGLVPILAIFGELFNGVLMLVIPLFKILAGVCLILVGVFNTLLVGIHMFNAGVMRVIASILSFIPGNKAKAEAAGRQADQMDETVQDTSDRAAKNFSDGANMIATASSSTAAELKGGSHGAAAKGASYTGVADLGKNMMQAAFGSSSSTVEDKQLKQQEQATGELSIIRGWLQNTFMKPKDPAQGVRK